MNDGEHRVLEYVRDQINGLREDVKDMRDEMRTTFMRHDESDNRRFAELFERIRPLEIGHALFNRGEEQDAETQHRAHGWAVTRMLTLGTLVGGAGAELLHQIIGFFTERGH